MTVPADAILFRGGSFSNFAVSPFSLQCPHTGVPRTYPTVEHYFQASKAVTLADHLSVAQVSTPRDAKRAGRTVALRPDWEQVKYEVMLTALRAKFARDPFRRKLVQTGDRLIAEDSPYDFEWGIRDSSGGYEGGNLLGHALMQVRDELRAAGPPGGEQLTLSVE